MEVKEVSRRQFGSWMLTVMWANILLTAGCMDKGSNPIGPDPAPDSGSKSLLTRVQEAGHASAARAADRAPGSSRIAIRGDLNWNFYAGDGLVLIGSSSSPTADVANLRIPNSWPVQVRSL